jgi:hypothetical protein
MTWSLGGLAGSRVLDWPDRLTDVTSWHSHIPFGLWCVEALRPRVLVELGTHKGDSYCAFCQAIDRLSLPAACYAIDTWKGDDEAGFYGEEVLEELQAYHDPRYAKFSRLVRSTFDEAAAHFSDGAIDLLHIDGLHTYEAVRHDFETWLPKLSRSAVVLFHDVNVRESDFGAWRYWEELTTRFGHFTFLHGHGLGVLVVGADPPEAARRLAASDAAEATRIRALFARLGDMVLARSKLGDLESRAGSLRAELERREGALAEIRQRAESGERELADRALRLQRLGLELDGTRAEQGRREAAIGELQGRLGETEEQLRNRDLRLQELGDELERARSELGRREAIVGQLRSELSAAEEAIPRLHERHGRELAACREGLAARLAELAAKDEELKRARLGLAGTEARLAQVLGSRSWRIASPLRPAWACCAACMLARAADCRGRPASSERPGRSTMASTATAIRMSPPPAWIP